MTTVEITAFNQLPLDKSILKALDEVGYETPTPIQAQAIPLLLAGKDIIGQAQTGTGKTAAFALPILSGLDLTQKTPQVLVLTPTRELAIQVAEAFQKYAARRKGFHVLPVYGGQDYKGQIRSLQRGVHVVVGTPGRVMDHMRRGTLKLDKLTTLVLDEADEMLRMGFIDDVEWVLQQIPARRQIALFSATMPQQIRRIAADHLVRPENITVKFKTIAADTIRQRFWPVSGVHKLDALTRILEAEPFDAMLIFVRTRTATVDLSEKLEARGHASTPLNGDIPQPNRERAIERLKQGKLDILVATDVAARGLDVGRISHVVNYDIPHDTEAYIHRIGRTGRAGKAGDAILFVAPREKRMLNAIEQATRQKIELMELPSTELINNRRIAGFKQRIADALATEELGMFCRMIEQFQQEHNVSSLEIAAALAHLLQGNTPLLLQHKPVREVRNDWKNDTRQGRGERGRNHRNRNGPGPNDPGRNGHKRSGKRDSSEAGMTRYRIEVGRNHAVRPGNIVGAVANEAGVESRNIGQIDIQDDYSTIDLPAGMPGEILKKLKKVWVCGQQLQIAPIPLQGKQSARKPGKNGGHSRKDKSTARTTGKAGVKTTGKARKNKDRKKTKPARL